MAQFDIHTIRGKQITDFAEVHGLKSRCHNEEEDIPIPSANTTENNQV